MIEFRRYIPADLAQVRIQPAQERHAARLSPAYAEALAGGTALTGLVDGRVVGCAGLTPQWEGRAVCWALFGADMPRTAWPRVVRRIREVFDQSGYRRIEADVRFGFGNGCRLAHLLGFKIEGLREKFGPDGEDYFLYARVTS